MIQSLPNTSQSFTLNPIQAQSGSAATQNTFVNQLCNTTSLATNPTNNFAQALMPLTTVPFASVPNQIAAQNFLLNNQQQLTENQQNLICLSSNGYLNNYPMNLMNNQQNNLNGLQSGYLTQSRSLTSSNEAQQNMLQLQMMNIKYKHIIQQQQQQLKQMQIQQLQQATQQHQQQQLNQIYSQQLPLMNAFNVSTSPNSSMNQLTLLQNNNQNAIKPCILSQYPTFLPSQNLLSGNQITDDFKDVLNQYQDITKVKVEINAQCSIQQFQSEEDQSQQQQQSSISSPNQSSTSLPQQQLNSKNETLSLSATQGGQMNSDYLSQSQINHLNTSQSSFQTTKSENHYITRQFSSELKLKLQGQTNLNSSRLASFTTSNTKLDEEPSNNFEGIHNKSQKSSQSEGNNNNSDKKRRHSIAIGSRQSNMDGDTQSYASYISQESYLKKNNENEEVIYKKRFVQVKQEDELLNNNEVKSVNIPQQALQKRSSNSLLSNSTAASSDEKNSILSNSDNLQKLDQYYLDFAKMSSFDSLQEASRSFDKLLSKHTVIQTIDLILSTLPAKPEESTNFENKFVNSMKAKQSKDKRNPNALYMTRFHNLTRLLMYNIVQLFSFDILSQNLNIHFYIAQELENICRKIKQHARQTCNGQFKTDFYTHSHYNGLFLILDKNTISHIKKSQKDIEIHQQVYGVDLVAAASNPSEQLEFEVKKCNFFKILAHEILMKCSYQSSENSLVNGDDARRIYFRRALSGISKLNKGQIVHRF